MKKKKRDRFTPLKNHVRKKSKFQHRLSETNLQMIEWERDLMPEHLWIDLLAEEYKKIAWRKIYEDFLDKLEQCIKEKVCLFGWVSDFGTVPEYAREIFLNSHKEFIYYAFYKPIGNILALYPENPANWLILDEWKNEEKVDFIFELNRLAKSLTRLIQAKDDYAGHIRALPVSRLFKHQKISLPSKGMEELISLLPKYPGQCNEKERYRVQSFARIQMNMEHMNSHVYRDRRWPKYFWRHNYDLIPCSPYKESLDRGKGGIPLYSSLDRIKRILTSTKPEFTKASNYLDKLAMQYKFDLYDPLKNEILSGLFSRITRLFNVFITDPNFWSRDLSSIFLRCMVETVISFHYLGQFGKQEDFQKFEEYGRGKEKLLMLHLQDIFKEQKSLDGKGYEDIAKDIGGGFRAEVTNIDIAISWSDKNAREMAKLTGLEDLYKLIFDPGSSDVHGTWTSIRKTNLVICTQILHRYHKMPKYFEPPYYFTALQAAQSIYIRCLDFAIDKLGFPKPDEEITRFEFPNEIKQQQRTTSKIPGPNET